MKSLFIKTPDGNLLGMSRIGGIKAISRGLLVLGNGQNEVLDFYACPPEVAIEWRNAMVELMRTTPANRSDCDIDWMALARAVAPDWVAKQLAA
jgi:hypothetical protein